MSVLHAGCEHCDEFRTDGFGVGAEDTVYYSSLQALVSVWQLPILRHGCVGAVWERWSRQKVCLQDSQRNGRKSSWWQYSSSQRAPMDSRSRSRSIWVKDCCWSSPLGNERGGDMIAEG